jgi:hypothetical protein
MLHIQLTVDDLERMHKFSTEALKIAKAAVKSGDDWLHAGVRVIDGIITFDVGDTIQPDGQTIVFGSMKRTKSHE